MNPLIRPGSAALLLTILMLASAGGVRSGPGAQPLQAQVAQRSLTVEETLSRARSESRALAALRFQVEEQRRRSSMVYSNFLPRVETQAGYLATDNTQGILIPTGSLGNYPELGGAFPPVDQTIPQGGTDLFLAVTTVQQPVTHFFQVRHAHRAAVSDVDLALARLDAAEQEVALAALQLHLGLRLAQLELEVADAELAATMAQVRQRESALEAGSTTALALQEARVRALQNRQQRMETEDRIQDLNYQLTDLLGLESSTQLRPDGPSSRSSDLGPLEGYLSRASSGHPEIVEARSMEAKARHGLAAARSSYIPEVGVLGAHVYQSSFPFFPRNTLVFGIQGKWTLLDFGARRATVGERSAQVSQTEANQDLVRSRVLGEVEAAYRRAARSAQMLELAREAEAVSAELARLRELEGAAGLGVEAGRLESEAQRTRARHEVLQAESAFILAVAELERASGIFTPP